MLKYEFFSYFCKVNRGYNAFLISTIVDLNVFVNASSVRL